MSDTSPRRRNRALVAATIGNALEFYDFLIFALFAIQIGKAFFPSHDPYASLMASLATFGAGFVTRPLGAWVIGGYADRHGRRPALLLTMVMMGVAMAALVLTPGYATLGLAAPVIAVVARLVQGFALGGEVGPATAYMVENAPERRRGLVLSLQRGSQVIAGILGALVGLVLTRLLGPQDFDAFGWRIALGLGVAVVPYALWIRRHLPETLHDSYIPPDQCLSAPAPVGRTIATGMVLMAAATVGAYVLSYMATFAQASLKLGATVAMAGQLAVNLCGLVAVVAGGWLSDRWGRRPVMIACFATTLIVAPLAFEWMTRRPDAMNFVLASSALALIGSFGITAINATIAESLPRARRARSFALIYAVPISLFGGTTQMVVTWLVHIAGHPFAAVWYPAAAQAIGLVAALIARESAPIRSKT